METDILAIFAHPDDMELTVGGTLLKMKSLGYKTGALDITQGEMGTRGSVEIRAREASDAARIFRPLYQCAPMARRRCVADATERRAADATRGAAGHQEA